jgi:hypothetical protein
MLCDDGFGRSPAAAHIWSAAALSVQKVDDVLDSTSGQLLFFATGAAELASVQG